MVEPVADVGGEGVEFVIREVRPCLFRQAVAAHAGKLRARNLEVAECAVQLSEIEWCIVIYDKIGIREKRQAFRGNILVRDPVDLNKVLAKPAMAVRRADEPVARIGQRSIDKNRDPGRTDTRFRVVGGFKIEGGDFHLMVFIPQSRHS